MPQESTLNSVDPKPEKNPAMNAAVDRPTTMQIAMWGAILLLMVIISLSNFQDRQLGCHWDDSQYVVLTRSLISSPVYGLINTPGEPAAGKYPFAYPLLLAPLMQLFPGDFKVLQVPSLIATILIAVVLFWQWKWFYPKKSYWWGLAVTGLFALAPITMELNISVMSEPVFTLFCLISILLAEQYTQGKRVWWWGTAMAASLTFTLFTRTIGVVLVVSVFLYLLVRIGLVFWKKMAAILLQMIFLTGLVVVLTPVRLPDLLPLEYFKDNSARFIVSLVNGSQDAVVEQDSLTSSPQETPVPLNSGSQESTSISTLLIYGVQQHFGNDLRNIVLPVGGGLNAQNLYRKIGIPEIPQVMGYLVSILTILGFFLLLRKHLRSLFLIFGILYFGLLFFWMWLFTRLLYPIQSQILFAFLVGIEAVIGWAAGLFHRKPLHPALKPFLVGMVAISLFSINTVKGTQIDDSRIHCGDLTVRTSWIASHSMPGDIVMTEFPETDYLYSGRKTLPYPLLNSASQFENDLLAQNVSYLLVAPNISWYPKYSPEYSAKLKLYFPVVDELTATDRLQLVYSSQQDGIKVYRVRQ